MVHNWPKTKKIKISGVNKETDLVELKEHLRKCQLIDVSVYHRMASKSLVLMYVRAAITRTIGTLHFNLIKATPDLMMLECKLLTKVVICVHY